MRDWDRRAYGGGVYREKKEDPSLVHSRFRSKLITVTLILLAMIFTAGVVAAVFLLFPDYEKPAPPETIVIEGHSLKDSNRNDRGEQKWKTEKVLLT